MSHAIDPNQPLLPVGMTVKQRYLEWHGVQKNAGRTFTLEQLKWLNAIADHIAQSLRIETDDFDYAPFTQLGGLGRAHQLFGTELPTLLSELYEQLAA